MAAISTAKYSKLLLTALLVVVAQAAMAQRHYLPHVHIGIHGGESLGNTSFFPRTPHKMISGMMAGVAFRYAEERHVGLQAEVNFDQRGWAENFKDEPLTYSRRLTYIELPVMTHIFFGSRMVKGFFNLGPQIGYLVGEKISSNFDYMAAMPIDGTPFVNRQTEQMKLPVTRKFDYGITAGAGIEFIIRRRHCITLEGRYYYGLGNVFPSSKKDYFSSSRGSTIFIKAGYMFRIK